jgi:hypothetical protein
MLPETTYRVSLKAMNGFARLYRRNPWDYRNGMGARKYRSSKENIL